MVPEIVPPKVHRLADMSDSGRLQTFPFGRHESTAEFLDRLVRKSAEESLEVAPQPDIQDAVGMADHEAEVVGARTLDAHHLPGKGFAAFLLEPESGQVADRLRDEVLVGKPRLQVEPYLESSMHGGSIPWGKKPPSFALIGSSNPAGDGGVAKVLAPVP